MKRLLLLMAVMLTAALSVQAQRTISGKVIDSEEQEECGCCQTIS